MPDYIYLMDTRLTPDQQKALSTIQEIARAQEMNVYLVGGAVRDFTSGFAIRDLDFAVQGNVLRLQKALEKAGAAIFGLDEDYRILHLMMPGNVRTEVSSTRSETFPKPGKPEISFDSIHEDLRRRDFSMNAMALSLNPGSRGLLLDPANGAADIEAKVIRILHNYSFLEDPSRLIRATRFAARFHWNLEERTQARYDAAKENDYIDAISNRGIGYEIEQIANEDDPVHVMKALEREGWMKVLYSTWNSSKVDTSSLNQLMKVRSQVADMGLPSEPSAAVMYFLTDRMPQKDAATMQRLLPRKGFVEAWKNLEEESKEFSRKLLSKELNAPSATWKFLMSSKPETILFTEVTTRQQAVAQKIRNFLHKWPQVRQKLPFPEMAEMRITPELPEYPKVMEEGFFLLLDGKLRSHNDIVKFLQPFAPPEPPPPPPVRRGRAAKKAEAAGEAAAPGKRRGRKKKEASMVTEGGESSALETVAAQVGSALGKLKQALMPTAEVEPPPPAPQTGEKAAVKKAPRKAGKKAKFKKSTKKKSQPKKKSSAKKATKGKTKKAKKTGKRR